MKKTAAFALLFASSFLLFASSAKAQTRLAGRVIDPSGKPVANLEVSLHGVDNENGTEFDHDTTDADGRFTMEAKEDPKLVYFVAVVWEKQLYVGEMLRTPFPPNQDYIVQVGIDPVNLSPEAENPTVTPEEKKQERSAGLAVILASLALIALIAYVVMTRRPPARRRMLLELARIEDEIAKGENDERLQKRRSELRTRLRAS
jgi:hypothetical protein